MPRSSVLLVHMPVQWSVVGLASVLESDPDRYYRHWRCRVLLSCLGPEQMAADPFSQGLNRATAAGRQSESPPYAFPCKHGTVLFAVWQSASDDSPHWYFTVSTSPHKAIYLHLTRGAPSPARTETCSWVSGVLDAFMELIIAVYSTVLSGNVGFYCIGGIWVVVVLVLLR